MSHWTDSFVGDRMAVDQQFSARVQASQFTSQEWGLIMTATELEMEHAADPESARIVADTTDVELIIPELENIRSQVASMGGAPGGAQPESNKGGLVASIKGLLGLGGGDSSTDGVDQAKLAAAESLTQEYADALQQHLEANDSFEQARTAYLESP